MAEEKFTHVGIEKPTQKRIALLARVRGKAIYTLVADWALRDWEQAKKKGLVNDTMLAHVVGQDGVVALAIGAKESAKDEKAK